MNDLTEEGPRPKRRFLEVLKRDAVRLIVEESYTFKAAAPAIGVSDQPLGPQTTLVNAALLRRMAPE